jgi:hypothetical protein
MTQNDFAAISLNILNRYLSTVSQLFGAGGLSSDVPNPIYTYPTHLIVGSASGYLFFELAGSSSAYIPLTIKFTKPESVYSFLGQAESGKPIINVEGHHTGLSRLLLQTSSSDKAIIQRFPKLITERYPTRLVADFDTERIFNFTKNTDFFCLEDVMLFNSHGAQSRLRNPILILIVSNKTNKKALAKYLNEELRLSRGEELRIVRTLENTDQSYLNVCSQFYNLYLQSNIHETLLGDFLNHHREVLLEALGGIDLIYEPELEWQVDVGQEEKSINPDFMIKRPDGYYDICDLKLPLLSKKSLTTGHSRDRSLIAYIHKGSSQIAGYRDYFEKKENRDYAMKKYGIRVASPQLTLVVGNYENYNEVFIKQAQRAYQNIRIIDYDTLINAYRMKLLEASSLPA